MLKTFNVGVNMVKKGFRKAAAAVALGVATAVTSITATVEPVRAVMNAADVTATTTGISDSLTLFYTIGGTILVVLASIWGFRKITGLLGGK